MDLDKLSKFKNLEREMREVERAILRKCFHTLMSDLQTLDYNAPNISEVEATLSTLIQSYKQVQLMQQHRKAICLHLERYQKEIQDLLSHSQNTDTSSDLPISEQI